MNELLQCPTLSEIFLYYLFFGQELEEKLWGFYFFRGKKEPPAGPTDRAVK